MEVGYCLNIKYWGQGFATEGFKAFLELFWKLPGSYPFLREGDERLTWIERRNINRLVAKTHPENVASHRVCEKCGGKKGGVLKDEFERFVDKGVKCDMWLFYFDRPGVIVEDGSDGRVDGKS